MNRIWFIYLFFLLLAAIVVVRMLWLSTSSNLVQEDDLAEKVVRRGRITDSRKHVLAFSEDRYNLFFDGRKESTIEEMESVAELSTVDRQVLANSKQNQKVILLKRFVSKSLALEFKSLDVNAILIEKVEERFYPENEMLAQTIGFVGYDGEGLGGLELYYDKALNYATSLFREKRLVLNVDSSFERVLEQKLHASVVENEGKSGVILVQEVKTGRIVAMAQSPTYNLNRFTDQDQQIFRNLAVNFLVEPGSIFKIFFVAYLLDNFEYDVTEKLYNCKGYYELPNGEVIKDHGVHGDVSINDIIKLSCNAGLIHLTERLDKREMFRFLTQLKINEKIGIDLPGESKGILPPLDEWGIRTKATIPIGQGIALTPLNLLNGFTALIGNGYLYEPKLVKSIETYEVNEIVEKEEIESKVISKLITDETSKRVIDLLVHGTVKGSTGYQSRKTGFEEVFGKTATSQLANLKKGGYYTDRYHSMFAGGYPTRDPQYTILVVVTEPKKEYYGGRVAAPLFAEVVEELIRFYKLPQERIVEKYQNSLIEGTEYDELVLEQFLDRIPDFKGLSFNRSLKLLEDFKKIQQEKGRTIRYDIQGSGYVVAQSPKAYSKVDNVIFVKLQLK